jgi:hypothetical protein
MTRKLESDYQYISIAIQATKTLPLANSVDFLVHGVLICPAPTYAKRALVRNGYPQLSLNSD